MRALLWIWQLPQHLLALLVIFFTKAKLEDRINGVAIYQPRRAQFGVSLGEYIIIGGRASSRMTRLHEWGHTRQSRMLGPLYLLIVGLPSITMNILSTWSFLYGSARFYTNYYVRWPESWADKLGGVDR